LKPTTILYQMSFLVSVSCIFRRVQFEWSFDSFVPALRSGGVEDGSSIIELKEEKPESRLLTGRMTVGLSDVDEELLSLSHSLHHAPFLPTSPNQINKAVLGEKNPEYFIDIYSKSAPVKLCRSRGSNGSRHSLTWNQRKKYRRAKGKIAPKKYNVRPRNLDNLLAFSLCSLLCLSSCTAWTRKV